jgi:hypothetical protein
LISAKSKYLALLPRLPGVIKNPDARYGRACNFALSRADQHTRGTLLLNALDLLSRTLHAARCFNLILYSLVGARVSHLANLFLARQAALYFLIGARMP